MTETVYVSQHGHGNQERAVPVRVTCVGSLPFEGPAILRAGHGYVCESSGWTPEMIERQVESRSRDVVRMQTELGLDIVSEGDLLRNEPERRNWGHAYIYYFARFISGFEHDYMDPTPRLRGQINAVDAGPVRSDFQRAARHSSVPVKICLPGPSTFIRRIDNKFYESLEAFATCYVAALQLQVRVLIEAGCRWIQFDDPHIIWNRDDWAFDLLTQLIEAVRRPGVNFVLHMCRGNDYAYGDRGLKTAERAYYADALERLSGGAFDYVCVERPLLADGGFGLNGYKGGVMLGLMDVARRDCESVDQLVADIHRARDELGDNDLIVAQNCGLKHLSVDVARSKIEALVTAARQVNQSADSGELARAG